jgi:hypothetical protein
MWSCWTVTGATCRKGDEQETRIKHERVQFVMCVWVPVKEGGVAKGTEKVLNGNRFAMLAAVSEVHQDFTRRA